MSIQDVTSGYSLDRRAFGPDDIILPIDGARPAGGTAFDPFNPQIFSLPSGTHERALQLGRGFELTGESFQELDAALENYEESRLAMTRARLAGARQNEIETARAKEEANRTTLNPATWFKAPVAWLSGTNDTFDNQIAQDQAMVRSMEKQVAAEEAFLDNARTFSETAQTSFQAAEAARARAESLQQAGNAQMAAAARAEAAQHMADAQRAFLQAREQIGATDSLEYRSQVRERDRVQMAALAQLNEQFGSNIATLDKWENRARVVQKVVIIGGAVVVTVSTGGATGAVLIPALNGTGFAALASVISHGAQVATTKMAGQYRSTEDMLRDLQARGIDALQTTAEAGLSCLGAGWAGRVAALHHAGSVAPTVIQRILTLGGRGPLWVKTGLVSTVPSSTFHAANDYDWHGNGRTLLGNLQGSLFGTEAGQGVFDHQAMLKNGYHVFGRLMTDVGTSIPCAGIGNIGAWARYGNANALAMAAHPTAAAAGTAVGSVAMPIGAPIRSGILRYLTTNAAEAYASWTVTLLGSRIQASMQGRDLTDEEKEQLLISALTSHLSGMHAESVQRRIHADRLAANHAIEQHGSDLQQHLRGAAGIEFRGPDGTAVEVPVVRITEQDIPLPGSKVHPDGSLEIEISSNPALRAAETIRAMQEIEIAELRNIDAAAGHPVAHAVDPRRIQIERILEADQTLSNSQRAKFIDALCGVRPEGGGPRRGGYLEDSMLRASFLMQRIVPGETEHNRLVLQHAARMLTADMHATYLRWRQSLRPLNGPWMRKIQNAGRAVRRVIDPAVGLVSRVWTNWKRIPVLGAPLKLVEAFAMWNAYKLYAMHAVYMGTTLPNILVLGSLGNSVINFFGRGLSGAAVHLGLGPRDPRLAAYAVANRAMLQQVRQMMQDNYRGAPGLTGSDTLRALDRQIRNAEIVYQGSNGRRGLLRGPASFVRHNSLIGWGIDRTLDLVALPFRRLGWTAVADFFTRQKLVNQPGVMHAGILRRIFAGGARYEPGMDRIEQLFQRTFQDGVHFSHQRAVGALGRELMGGLRPGYLNNAGEFEAYLNTMFRVLPEAERAVMMERLRAEHARRPNPALGPEPTDRRALARWRYCRDVGETLDRYQWILDAPNPALAAERYRRVVLSDPPPPGTPLPADPAAPGAGTPGTAAARRAFDAYFRRHRGDRRRRAAVPAVDPVAPRAVPELTLADAVRSDSVRRCRTELLEYVGGTRVPAAREDIHVLIDRRIRFLRDYMTPRERRSFLREISDALDAAGLPGGPPPAAAPTIPRRIRRRSAGTGGPPRRPVETPLQYLHEQATTFFSLERRATRYIDRPATVEDFRSGVRALIANPGLKGTILQGPEVELELLLKMRSHATRKLREATEARNDALAKAWREKIGVIEPMLQERLVTISGRRTGRYNYEPRTVDREYTAYSPATAPDGRTVRLSFDPKGPRAEAHAAAIRGWIAHPSTLPSPAVMQHEAHQLLRAMRGLPAPLRAHEMRMLAAMAREQARARAAASPGETARLRMLADRLDEAATILPPPPASGPLTAVRFTLEGSSFWPRMADRIWSFVWGPTATWRSAQRETYQPVVDLLAPTGGSRTGFLRRRTASDRVVDDLVHGRGPGVVL